MKRLLIWAVVFLSLVSAVYAQNNTIELTATYFTGDSFEFKDDLYIVNVNSYDEAILNFNDKYLVIKNGTCTYNTVNYEFCAVTIEYDADKMEKKVDLEIYSSEPEITVTRTVTNSTLVVGEIAQITVTIENTGFNRARNVTYMDSYPIGINLSVPMKYRGTVDILKNRAVKLENGTKVAMDTAFWQGDLRKGESVTFTYYLTPMRPIDKEFSASIQYVKGTEKIYEETDTIHIKGEPYFELRTNIISKDYHNQPGETDVSRWEGENNLYSGEDVFLVLDVVNTYVSNKSVDVADLRFYFPDGVEYVGDTTMFIFNNASNENASYMTRVMKLNRVTDHFFNWSGAIPKDGQTFVIKLRAAKKAKEHIIRIAGDFAKKDLPKIYDYSVTEKFEVEREDMIIESNFEDKEKFSSGTEKYFTFYLVNPNAFANFTDVEINYSVPWLDNHYYYVKTLKSFNYSDVFNGIITLPTVTSSTTLYIRANITYSTPFGERITDDFERGIVVEPPAAVEIIHNIGGALSYGSGSLEIDNKETEVLLSINNKIEDALESITVTEVFSSDLNPAEQISNKVIRLNKAEVSDVYKYKIDPPDRSEWQNYTIKTYVSYELSGVVYNQSFDLDLQIKPKVMDIDITKTIVESDVNKGQIVNVMYEITNTEAEPIKDVTIVYPVQYETDVIGSRNFTIDKILAGERVVVSNQEKVRIKTDENVKIEKSKVFFKDEAGNRFTDESSVVSFNSEQGSLESLAIFVNQTAPFTVNMGEKFTVNVTIMNKGNSPGSVTISYKGDSYTYKTLPQSERKLSYPFVVEDKGIVSIPQVTANYSIGGLDYYTASKQVEVYSREKTEKKPIVIHKVTEKVQEEKKKTVFNVKYLYLAGFIVLICLLIIYIIRRPKKDEDFEFIE